MYLSVNWLLFNQHLTIIHQLETASFAGLTEMCVLKNAFEKLMKWWNKWNIKEETKLFHFKLHFSVDLEVFRRPTVQSYKCGREGGSYRGTRWVWHINSQCFVDTKHLGRIKTDITRIFIYYADAQKPLPPKKQLGFIDKFWPPLNLCIKTRKTIEGKQHHIKVV